MFRPGHIESFQLNQGINLFVLSKSHKPISVCSSLLLDSELFDHRMPAIVGEYGTRMCAFVINGIPYQAV